MTSSSGLSHRKRPEAAEGSLGQYKQLMKLIYVCEAPKTQGCSQVLPLDLDFFHVILDLLELMAEIPWAPMFHPWRQGCPLQPMAVYRRGKYEMFKLVGNFL